MISTLMALFSIYIAIDLVISISSNKMVKADILWALQQINGVWQGKYIINTFNLTMKQCFEGRYNDRCVIAGYIASVGTVGGTFVAMNLNYIFNEKSAKKNPTPTKDTEIIGEWLFYYNIFPKVKLSMFRKRKKDIFDKEHFPAILNSLESAVKLVESNPSHYDLIAKNG